MMGYVFLVVCQAPFASAGRPHAVAEDTAPIVQYSSAMLIGHLCLKGVSAIHQVAVRRIWDQGSISTFLITGTTQSWDIASMCGGGVAPLPLPDKDLSDLFAARGMRCNYIDQEQQGAAGDESDPEDAAHNLEKWLEEILTEHGVESELPSIEKEIEQVEQAVEKPSEAVVHVDANQVVESMVATDTPLPQFLEQMSLVNKEVGSRRVVIARAFGEKNLGVVRFLPDPNGLNMQTTCSRHLNCRCHCQPKPSSGWTQDTLVKAMVRWLNMADKVDGLEHSESSVRLRERCGHVVKPKKN